MQAPPAPVLIRARLPDRTPWLYATGDGLVPERDQAERFTPDEAARRVAQDRVNHPGWEFETVPA